MTEKPNCTHLFVCLCLGFMAQSTTRLCRASQLIVVLFLGRLRPSKRLTSTLGSNWQLPLGFNSQDYNISVMFSRLSKDRTLEMEDGWKIKKKIQPTRPARAANTAGPCTTICKSSRTPRHSFVWRAMPAIQSAIRFSIHISKKRKKSNNQFF